jgi:hypothetical protein
MNIRRSGFSLAAIVTALAALALGSTASAVRGPSESGRAAGASTLAGLDRARSPVVASLDRRYRTGTPRFELSASRATIPYCRAAEVVFYAARDWLRLAAKLAERPSLCADYYVSIPPLVADKTQPRPNQASRIRALGPRFHAMAEIHWGAWQGWVDDEIGRTWYDAGVEARRRMAAAGYDVASGDTWAVNEFPSTVRRKLGGARADARAFALGLYEGDGRPSQGAVFVIGVRHGTSDASLYKSTLKSWIADTPFWRDMDRAIRFWGQEVYGDARRWGVAGASAVTRRDHLNEYLQHVARLGLVAPPSYGAARAFLERAHTPVANGGWQWPTGLGWTMVSGDQMRHFVSAQTYALRSYAASKGGPDRFGFAWAPNNAMRMPYATFVAETGQLLDRLAAGLADSAGEASFDPGIGACAATGLDWCDTDVAGAEFTAAWRIFSDWPTPSKSVSWGHRRLVDRVRALLARERAGFPRLES